MVSVGWIKMLQKEKNMVSIIIPIYKVEKYLNQCMTSIIHQTYFNLDIIMVDDGSPDLCPELCEQWRKRDARIQVIHKNNSGLSDARNAGLRLAKGKFVMFVDSDDWISFNMVEHMVEAIERNEADMVVCQFVNVFPNGHMNQNYCGQVGQKIIDREKALQLLAEDRQITNHVWRKLYKKELIPVDIFPKGKNFEDIMVMPILVGKCKKIVYMDEPLYFYRQNAEGIVNSRTVQNIQDNYDAVIEACNVIKEICPSTDLAVRKSKLAKELYIWKVILSSGNSQDTRLKK